MHPTISGVPLQLLSTNIAHIGIRQILDYHNLDSAKKVYR
jgi:hypothetical protein